MMLKHLKHAYILTCLPAFFPFAYVYARDYEEINTEDASHYLPGKADSSKPYVLLPRVESDGFINQYRIQSEPGDELIAAGTDLAGERLHELEIIQALSEIKQTDAFMQGLNASVDMTLKASEQVLEDPGEAMKNLEKGFSRFVDNVGATVSDLAKRSGPGGGDGENPETGLVKEFLGVNSARRRLAVDFKVDPYSSNQVLQKSLEDVAMAIIAGGASLDLALQSAPGAASAIRKTAAIMEDGSQHYLHFSPKILRFKINEHLAGAEFSSEKLDEVLDNTACTWRHAATVAGALVRINLPAVNEQVFSWALAAENEAECRRRMHMMELAWDYRRRNKITDLWVNNDQLYWHDSLDSEGIALVADHLFWTPELEKLIEQLDTIYKVVWLSGEVSDRVSSEMTNRGIKLSPRRFKRLKGRENIGNSILAGSELPELEPLPGNDASASATTPAVGESSSEERKETAIIEQEMEPVVAPAPVAEVEEIDNANAGINDDEPVDTPNTSPAEEAATEAPPNITTAMDQEEVNTPAPSSEEIIAVDEAPVEKVSPPLEEEELTEVVSEEKGKVVEKVMEPVAAVEKAAAVPARKTTRPGCWQHANLGNFLFSQKGRDVELTHETPDKSKIRKFTLKDEGNRLLWSTNNVVHAFVRDLEGMRLFINVKKGDNEVKLERCTE